MYKINTFFNILQYNVFNQLQSSNSMDDFLLNDLMEVLALNNLLGVFVLRMFATLPCTDTRRCFLFLSDFSSLL